MKPHASGGSNDMSNIRVVSKSENRKNRKTHPENYGKLQGKGSKATRLKRALARRARSRKG